MSTYPSVNVQDNTSIPGIGWGLGTAWYACEDGDAENKGNRELIDSAKLAIKAGYVHLDNAECYLNETSCGIAIAEAGVDPKNLFICTKIADGLKDLHGNFANQLKKLQVDRVDLLLIHWPFLSGKNGYPTLEESWLGLEQIKKEGKALSIGVSNYRIRDLEATLTVATPNSISVNQIELHPYIYTQTKPLLEYLKSKNIKVEAYAPSAPLNKFAGGPLDPVLEKIALAVSARNGGKAVTGSQILLKWISQLGHVVITTTSKEWRMQEQLKSFAIGDLLPEEMEEIERVGKEGGGPNGKRVYMPHMDE